jgi:O-antigen ligase
VSIVNHAAQQPGSAIGQIQESALADKFLHAVLYITVFSGAFVIVEPAPYEFLAAVLGFACLLARVPFNRLILPLFILLLIRDASATIGLLLIQVLGFERVVGDPTPILAPFGPDDSTRFLAISFYLGMTSVVFACIFAQEPMRALRTVRSAYVVCGTLAGLLGTLGYFATFFDFLPALKVFAMNERAVGVFKDPNVLGCFVVPPLVWVIEGFVIDRIRPLSLIASIFMLLGALLSFSRAAWGSVAFCIIMLMYLLYLTQKERRTRILFLVGAAIVVAVLILIALSSIDVVRQMLTERLGVQDYDLGGDNRSRFMLQADSWHEILNHPLGMGPWGFAHTTSWVSHNTYLGTLLNHGWIGGAAYLLLTVLTLYMGFKAIWIRTPWQTFLIGTYLAFVALALEAAIVDTDHWRHYYLLLGIVWGLTAATVRFTRGALFRGTTRPDARGAQESHA